MSPLFKFTNPSAVISEWQCAPGEKFILDAPTGWGKTQWLRQLALLRDGDTSSIEWQGKRIEPHSVGEFRSQWMYLPQQPYRSEQTVEEHLSAVLKFHSHHSKELNHIIQETSQTLKTVGLEKVVLQKRKLKELSGGEIQILALVRSVLLSPQGLLLDEPTSALDYALCIKAEKWFFSRYLGALIWVTHDSSQVLRLKERGLREIDLSSAPARNIP